MGRVRNNLPHIASHAQHHQMETTNEGPRFPSSKLLKSKVRRPTRIGVISGGPRAYWHQFSALMPQLQESARNVAARLTAIWTKTW
jgi:hypothetical protein